MRRPFFLIIFSFLFTPVLAQGDVIAWKKEAARISRAEFFKDPRQAEVMYFTNLVRTNPGFFVSEFLEGYSDSLNRFNPVLYRKEKRYIESLREQLKNLEPMPALKPDPVLTRLATEHAEYTGRTGKTGHVGKNGRSFSERMKSAGIQSACGENCDYGRFSGYDVFMSLLVDEGIRDLGHRKNILNPVYTRAGVGWAGHKTYRVNCVIHYASGDTLP